MAGRKDVHLFCMVTTIRICIAITNFIVDFDLMPLATFSYCDICSFFSFLILIISFVFLGFYLRIFILPNFDEDGSFY